jgi:bacteriocin-like protein
MSKPSDPKSETTIASELPAQAPEKSNAQQGELSEEELNKVSGGGKAGSNNTPYLTYTIKTL